MLQLNAFVCTLPTFATISAEQGSRSETVDSESMHIYISDTLLKFILIYPEMKQTVP